MNFRKSSKRPLSPPPSFSKNHVADFFQNSWPKYPFIMAKICNINFWIGNDPPPLRNFSENSSVLVPSPVPNTHDICLLRTAFQFCHFFIFRLHLFFVAEVREQSLVAALSAVDALLVAKNNSHLGCPSIRQALCDCARISKHQANNICTWGTVAIYFIASRL